MQAKGYGILARKAKDERIKQLLLRISSDEASHAEFWFERIKELGGKHEGATKTLPQRLEGGLHDAYLRHEGLL